MCSVERNSLVIWVLPPMSNCRRYRKVLMAASGGLGVSLITSLLRLMQVDRSAGLCPFGSITMAVLSRTLYEG